MNEESSENNTIIESNNTAIQELYELTQRKFLRQLIQFSSLVSTARSYPRLFCIDFIDEDKISKLKFIKNFRSVSIGAEKIDSEKPEISEDNVLNSKLIPCIRPMCEHEESWHFSDCVVILPELLSIFCPFLVRLITILKNGSSSNELGVFLTDQGNKLFSEMEKSINESIDLSDSYNSFRNVFISEFEKDRFYSLSWLSGNWNNKPLGLENCELRNAKVLWLCNKHSEQTDAEILSDQDNFTTNPIEQEKNSLIKELEKIEMNIY
ncbi:serine threonine- kinase pats1 [Brachionus plicatilis]|uniref:Serine threonine-kinase pats1 n=1 Tax=Brachionus plicatilis TaxID=10195 RepID=A0A3M7SZ74_BRAPC|nr:serine threonine- kinase pats1 [Brachionus plicatilis]